MRAKAKTTGNVLGLPVVEEIACDARFAELKDEWNSLLAASASDGVFLTWDWLYTWWQHLAEDRRLSVLAVRAGGELIAVAPLALRPWNVLAKRPFTQLEFLGSGFVGSDYLDLIVRRGRESLARRVLSSHLASRRHVLKLTQLRKGACFAAEVASNLGQSRWSVKETPINVCPHILLAGETWDSYLTSLGSSHRYNFNRKLRRLEREFDVRLDRAATPGECRTALDLVIDLHNRRWSERGGSDAFHTEGLVNFHRDFVQTALQRDWLRLYVLRLNGQPAAALYGLRYGKSFYFYQSGFNPDFEKYGVGVVLMGMVIQRAIEEGADEFDMLHGNEPYKSHWCRQSRDLARLELYPPGGLGWLYLTSVNLARSSRQLRRRVLADGLAS